MSILLDGNLGITTPAETVQGALTTTGNTILGDATTDTLNVGAGGLVKDASGNVGIGTASPTNKLHAFSTSATATLAKFGATNYGNLGTTYIEIGTQYVDGGSRIGNINTYSNFGTLVFETMTAVSQVFAERMRIDSSGNLLVGTTSTSGSVNNNTQVVGGIFSTSGASGISALNATATTLVTLPNVSAGCWLVSATLPGQGAAASYSVVAIVTTQGTTSSITTIKTATLATLSMSGLNVQITQSSGGTQANCAYTALRLF